MAFKFAKAHIFLLQVRILSLTRKFCIKFQGWKLEWTGLPQRSKTKQGNNFCLVKIVPLTFVFPNVSVSMILRCKTHWKCTEDDILLLTLLCHGLNKKSHPKPQKSYVCKRSVRGGIMVFCHKAQLLEIVRHCNSRGAYIRAPD